MPAYHAGYAPGFAGGLRNVDRQQPVIPHAARLPRGGEGGGSGVNKKGAVPAYHAGYAPGFAGGLRNVD
ncbi:hypothetical protein YWS52_00010 [Chitiniphilus shinanonensis]